MFSGPFIYLNSTMAFDWRHMVWKSQQSAALQLGPLSCSASWFGAPPMKNFFRSYFFPCFDGKPERSLCKRKSDFRRKDFSIHGDKQPDYVWYLINFVFSIKPHGQKKKLTSFPIENLSAYLGTSSRARIRGLMHPNRLRYTRTFDFSRFAVAPENASEPSFGTFGRSMVLYSTLCCASPCSLAFSGAGCFNKHFWLLGFCVGLNGVY